MHKILVTGGCGYIGSHVVVDLIENGYQVVSIDNCVNSSEDSLDGVEEITGKKVINYKVDLCDLASTKKVFEEHPDLKGIIHFAALKAVNESVNKPFLYYNNNIGSLVNVLECSREFEVPHFVYSSSCTVYGNAETLPVTEESPILEAESPYGLTKQVGEMLLKDCTKVFDLKAISLRYFNPVGAHPSAIIGESPINTASNLVPLITETAIGKREELLVYGDDYDTRDGSCIRDYIHIMDLARAHTLSFDYAVNKEKRSFYDIFNVGSGVGISVLEAILAFEMVSGQKLNYKIGPRREGDVEAIYANYSKAERLLGWKPKFTIEDMMSTAWRWEMQRSKE